jgi:hypothetical protein
MTSYELIQTIDSFLERRSSYVSLLNLLSAMAISYDDMFSFTIDQLGTGSAKSETKSTRKIIEVGAQFRHVNIRQIFREVDGLVKCLEELDLELRHPQVDPRVSIKRTLEDFAVAYEKLVQGTSISTSLTAMRLAKEVLLELEPFSSVLELIVSRLMEEPQMGEGRGSLSLLLQPSDEVRVFVTKVRSLEVVYEEICRLLNISTSEYPLEIAKIEAGSPLWTKLFGESKVIKLATDLIKEAVDYRYRNFTREGQLGSIPRKVDELGSVLNLEARMAALGYDTTNMRESLQKSGVVIARELNTLLSGETEVVVNGELFSLTSVVDQLIAEKRKTLLLEDGANDSEEPTNDEHPPSQPEAETDENASGANQGGVDDAVDV